MENLAQLRMGDKNEAAKILKRLNFPLASQDVYWWNSSRNNFEKENRGVIYNNIFESEGIIFKKEEADLDNDSILGQRKRQEH